MAGIAILRVSDAALASNHALGGPWYRTLVLILSWRIAGELGAATISRMLIAAALKLCECHQSLFALTLSGCSPSFRHPRRWRGGGDLGNIHGVTGSSLPGSASGFARFGYQERVVELCHWMHETRSVSWILSSDGSTIAKGGIYIEYIYCETLRTTSVRVGSHPSDNVSIFYGIATYCATC